MLALVDGMSLRAAASELGFSHSLIAKWRAGEVSDMSPLVRAHAELLLERNRFREEGVRLAVERMTATLADLVTTEVGVDESDLRRAERLVELDQRISGQSTKPREDRKKGVR